MRSAYRVGKSFFFFFFFPFRASPSSFGLAFWLHALGGRGCWVFLMFRYFRTAEGISEVAGMITIMSSSALSVVGKVSGNQTSSNESFPRPPIFSTCHRISSILIIFRLLSFAPLRNIETAHPTPP